MQHRETNEITYSLGKINKKSASWSNAIDEYKNEFGSYKDAVDALIEHHSDEFKITDIKRTAVDVYIPKKDVSIMTGVDDTYTDRKPEELMAEYGFRGIQFGNYLTQKERQAYVNNTFHSLDLLANILNMPKRWIGGGKLGLAFGARGHGFAAAHYELELHVINLTRFNGPGCIAHEIFHSFDSRMAKRWFGRDALLSNLVANNEVSIENVDARYRERFYAFTKLSTLCTDFSSFTENAKRIESQKGSVKYWSKPSELCARAFEAFIQDKLEDQNINKQWLALGTLESDYPLNDMHPYPVGDFRKRLHVALSELIPVIFTR
ncbi:LPD1 domain-containing protein [Marinomonas sp. TI.3.20]|uniref:LPD1 domain-containing protein n=1 Tax=Marinomonas sp. TI.3.20 TaxID=3121296 RepID=UPI00311DBD52